MPCMPCLCCDECVLQHLQHALGSLQQRVCKACVLMQQRDEVEGHTIVLVQVHSQQGLNQLLQQAQGRVFASNTILDS